MWSISRLKQEARNSFKRFGYWMPLFITFLFGIIANGSTGLTGASASASTSSIKLDFVNNIDPSELGTELTKLFDSLHNAFNQFFSNPIFAISTSFILLISITISLVLTFGWNVFIVYPLEVGKSRYFMEHRAFETSFTKCFWAFKNGRYLNIVKIMFLRYLKICLWSLLFIIPGIIKSYQYRMIPYILAENPNISCDRAFELTKKMTKGEKWHMFILDLSFIGWLLLGILCCCVGDTFVVPYIEATEAELYQVMREKAHGLGFSDFAELPGFFPEQA